MGYLWAVCTPKRAAGEGMAWLFMPARPPVLFLPPITPPNLAETLSPLHPWQVFDLKDEQKIEGAHEVRLEEIRIRLVSPRAGSWVC